MDDTGSKDAESALAHDLKLMVLQLGSSNEEKKAAIDVMQLVTYHSVKSQDGSFDRQYTFLKSLYDQT